MEENIMTNEVAEQVADQLIDTATNDMTVVPAQTCAQPVVASSNGTGKTVMAAVGGFVGGIAVSAAFNHWVAPKLSKALADHKAKKAKKKAEKEAKKAGKSKDSKKAETEHPEPQKPYDVETMKKDDLKIDDLEN